MKRERLIQERKKLKQSRSQLAEQLGISEVYVRMIENGQHKPGRDLMIKFEKHYGYTMKTLFPDIFLTTNDKKLIKTGTE